MEEQAIHISLKPEVLFEIAGLPITNSMVTMWLVSIILVVIFAVVALRLKKIPGRSQLFLEALIDGMYGFVKNVGGSEKFAKLMYPIFATLVVFFLLSNLLGLIPGLAAISINGVSAFRLPTTDYPLVFALTMVMFILWQMVAAVSGGMLGYVKKYINFSSPIDFVMGILDIFGELAKIVSLSFRLFGNIFAGEVIATVMLVLAPYVVPVPFALLGILSSVIQAFVFPILVLIFVKMSVAVREEQASENTN